MGEYTGLAALSLVVILVLEFGFWRTGLFARLQYWVSMAIVFGFMMLVDGWLTKLSAPIVLYDDSQTLGVRAPWDIPVEDFAFGFSMVTLVLLTWVRLTGRKDTP